MLAYAAAPDPDPQAPALPITTFELAHGPSAHRPSPLHVDHEQVAAHAARHLALVTGTSPQVQSVLSADPALCRALDTLPRAAAGQLSPA